MRRNNDRIGILNLGMTLKRFGIVYIRNLKAETEIKQDALFQRITPVCLISCCDFTFDVGVGDISRSFLTQKQIL